MTLQFICAEIERLHRQIRRQQKEVFTLQRSGIGTASAELLLARMQASVDAMCIRSSTWSDAVAVRQLTRSGLSALMIGLGDAITDTPASSATWKGAG